MGAVVNRQAISATGQYLLVAAGTGYGQGGWQVAIAGTFTGSGTLKISTSAPGSALTLGSAITYYLVDDGSSSAAALTAAANVIVQNVGSDLYLDVTSLSAGTIVVTVMAAGELIGQEEGLLPALNPAFTGTMTGPAVTVTGTVTYGTKLASTTALATPAALAATAFNGFASTVSGAVLMGFGTTHDVALKNQAGNTIWGVPANETAISSLQSGQVTARIIGGATNGLSLRNSANTRDNVRAYDDGTIFDLTDGTRIGGLRNFAATGELPSSITLSARNGTTNVFLLAGDGTPGVKAGTVYYNATQYYSAWEVVNVAAGFGTLALMKSGGAVTINDGATGAASALYIKGSAYGAATAAIRIDGHTSGAGASAGTIANAPAAGNPAFWMPINIAGTVRYFPCW